MRRSVHLPALDRHVSLPAYVGAVRRAKANPNLEFKQGLDCWWSCTGAEIVRQYRRAMHARISAATPYSRRGLPSGGHEAVRPVQLRETA